VVDHNSIATRDAYTRQGGRWIPLAGPCRYNDDIYVTVLSGLGMAPITNNVQSWALAAGSFYQNTKITDRVVSLSFTVKKKDLRFHTKPDLTRLRKLRQELIEVFKPDRTAGGEPFLFSYDEGDKELFVWLRYEAGLEGEWDIRNPYTNSFPVRLIAVDPILFEDSQDAYALNFISRELMNCIACRKNGEWKSMNYGLNSVAYSMAVGKKTDLYVGGNFTVVNNNAVAINPLLLANRLAVWDGTSFSALSSVGPTMIYTVAIAPNGDIYVGGAFTTIGGVAANRIARWDGATWNALGTGLTGGVGTNCYRITIAPNGDVYAAGNFTAAGGITVHEIARWSGGAWHSMGTYAGLNSSVMAMVIDPMGTTLYLGGVFTDQYSLAGTALSMVASYNPTTNLFSPVGLGFNSPPDDVETLAFSPSGKLYAGGGFVSSGTTVLNRIAMFNGSAWVPLGTGMNDYIWEISVDKNENVIATGPFTTAGGVPVTRIALWNGTSWNQADAYPDASKDVREVVISPAGDVYICGDFIYLIHSAITYITNRGTTETKPIIYISGPGYLHWIENQTTQQRVYINLNISVGEEIVIDFGRGTIHSNTRGDMNYTILSGSDFANFSLSPGENKLCCFMDHDTNAGMYIYSTPQHWSVDAIVPQEDLG
jgi:hypothetical protein